MGLGEAPSPSLFLTSWARQRRSRLAEVALLQREVNAVDDCINVEIGPRIEAWVYLRKAEAVLQDAEVRGIDHIGVVAIARPQDTHLYLVCPRRKRRRPCVGQV